VKSSGVACKRKSAPNTGTGAVGKLRGFQQESRYNLKTYKTEKVFTICKANGKLYVTCSIEWSGAIADDLEWW